MNIKAATSTSQVVDIQNSYSDKVGSGSTKSMWLVNNTSRIFTVIDRSNIPLVYESPKGSYFSEDKIILYTHYEWFNNGAITNTRKLLDLSLCGVARNPSNEDQFLIYDVLSAEIKKKITIDKASCTIARTFSLSDFASPFSRRYIDACDVVIDSDYNKDQSHHPQSHIGRVVYGQQDLSNHHAPINPPRPLSSIRLEIDFVDNEGRYGNKYLYFGNSVVTITPIKDPSRANGIYKTMMSNPSGNLFTDTSVLSLQDAKDVLGLADSQDEAMHAKDVSQAMDEATAKEIATLKLAEAQARTAAQENQKKLDEQKYILEEQKRHQEMAYINDKASAELRHQEAMNEIKRLAQEADLNNARIIANLKREVEEAKVESTLKTQSTAVIKDGLDREEAFRKHFLTGFDAERKAYYEKTEREASMATTLVKHLPALAVGVGGAIIANKLFSSNSSSFSGVKW